LQKVYRISYIHLVRMSIIVLLLGISLCIALFFLVAFVWSVQGGQFDDQVTPAMRMLNDDDAPKPKSSSSTPDKGPPA
jgi:cbb3-type cytochrome oxidase maturation protein